MIIGGIEVFDLLNELYGLGKTKNIYLRRRLLSDRIAIKDIRKVFNCLELRECRTKDIFSLFYRYYAHAIKIDKNKIYVGISESDNHDYMEPFTKRILSSPPFWSGYKYIGVNGCVYKSKNKHFSKFCIIEPPYDLPSTLEYFHYNLPLSSEYFYKGGVCLFEELEFYPKFKIEHSEIDILKLLNERKIKCIEGRIEELKRKIEYNNEQNQKLKFHLEKLETKLRRLKGVSQ